DGIFDPWLRKLHLTRPEPLTRAVDDVSLDIAKGEVVGLVGESGCGKSTLGRMAAGIMEPTAGQVLVNGQDLKTLPRREADAARLKIQMIFQDPYASLNPRMRVRDIVGESPRLHNMVSARDLDRDRKSVV